MKKFKHFAIMLALMTCTATWVYSQQTNNSEKKIQKEYTGEQANALIPGANYIREGKNTSLPATIRLHENANVSSSEFVPWLKKTMKLNANVDFKEIKQESDELGFNHQRYIQTVKGIPVDNSMYVVKSKGGKVLYINGSAYDLPSAFSAVAGITESSALEFALNNVGAQRYKWQDEYWENNLKKTEGENATYFPTGQLVWWQMPDKIFRLAYRFDISAASPFSEKRLYIDANTGEVLKVMDLMHNCVGATVNTAFNGVQNISTEFYADPNYRTNDDCQAAYIWVRDWNSATTTSNVIEIENSTNTWTTQTERFGGSALYTIRKAYEYFLNAHSLNTPKGDGTGVIEAYVNAVFDDGSGGLTMSNASMSPDSKTMLIGIGNGPGISDSRASIGTMTHEYCHAVTNESSNLVYQDESGALNESFSDIFSEANEDYLGTADWLIGGERTSGAIRDLAEPNNGNDPDTYMGDNWKALGGADNGGVHSNSGVQNFWFYLLVNGGTGTNDNGDDYSVSGIGFTKARNIAFRNLTLKLGVNSQYADARDGAIDAAQDLYGVCSDEAVQVANAWHAVGVGITGFEIVAANYEEISCNGACDGSGVVEVKGGVLEIYEWSNGETTPSVSGLCADYYSVTVTNFLGFGCSLEADFTLYDPLPLEVALNSPTYNGYNITCKGACNGVAIANPSGGTGAKTYTWSDGQITKSASNLCAGTYSVTVVDANGCVVSESITLTEPPALTLTVDATSDYNGYDVRCHGGSDGVAEAFPGGGVGGFEYEWNDPSSQTTKIATGLMAITYTVTVTDDNNCTIDESVTLTEPPQLTLDAGPNKIVYYGYPDSACAKLQSSGAGGGVPPYTLTWSTGSHASFINVCPITTTRYDITITDKNNCTFYDSVKVCAIDVRCGRKLDNVVLCHKAGGDTGTITICVDRKGAKYHFINHPGIDQLAACGTLKVCSFTGPSAKSDEGIVFEAEQSINDGLAYLNALPNPFTDNTTIRFTLPNDENVTLQVFDVSGKLVAKVFEGQVQAAELREATFDGSLYTNGIYLLSMNTASGERMVKRIVLAR